MANETIVMLFRSWNSVGYEIENNKDMAKKVVATLKTSTGKSYAKVIRMARSPKTNAYVFQEEIVPSDNVQEYLKKK